MKKIPLTKGKFALVDDKDFILLNQSKWYLTALGYAAKKGGKTGIIYMHQLLRKVPIGLEVDHKNRNKLDNRKDNLRAATRSQNQLNRGIQRNNTSGYKGVFYESGRSPRWRAAIMVDYKKINLGSFSSLQSAVFARKKAEEIYCLI